MLRISAKGSNESQNYAFLQYMNVKSPINMVVDTVSMPF